MEFFTEKIYTLNDWPSLKKQYRNFVMDLHPDRCGGNDIAFKKMKGEYDIICEALSVNERYETTANTSEKTPTEKTPEPNTSNQKKSPEANKEKQTYNTYNHHNDRLYADIRPEVLNNPWGAIVIWYVMFLVSLSIGFLGGKYRLIALFCVLGSMWYLYIKGKDAYGHWLTLSLFLYTLGVVGKGGYSSLDDWLADFVVMFCIMPIFWLYSIYIRSEG